MSCCSLSTALVPKQGSKRCSHNLNGNHRKGIGDYVYTLLTVQETLAQYYSFTTVCGCTMSCV